MRSPTMEAGIPHYINTINPLEDSPSGLLPGPLPSGLHGLLHAGISHAPQQQTPSSAPLSFPSSMPALLSGSSPATLPTSLPLQSIFDPASIEATLPGSRREFWSASLAASAAPSAGLDKERYFTAASSGLTAASTGHITSHSLNRDDLLREAREGRRRSGEGRQRQPGSSASQGLSVDRRSPSTHARMRKAAPSASAVEKCLRVIGGIGRARRSRRPSIQKSCHVGKVYKCSQCSDKSYPSQSNLRRHVSEPASSGFFVETELDCG